MYIKVRVFAGSKKEEFKKISKTHSEARVREKGGEKYGESESR